MGIKITELPSTPVNDADYIPVANTQSGTRKVLMADVLDSSNVNYEDLPDKPSINGIVLEGNTTTRALGLDNVFWAVYNVTTVAEIEAAYQAGKVILCNYNGYTYRHEHRANANNHYFAVNPGPTVTLLLNRNEYRWEATTNNLVFPDLSTNLKAALLQLAQKVVYIDANGQDYYDDLYDALYEVTSVRLSDYSLNLDGIGWEVRMWAETTPAGAPVTWSSSDASVVTVTPSGTDACIVETVGYGSATITAIAGNISARCSVVVAEKVVESITATYTQSGYVYPTTSLDSLKSDLVVTARWSDSTTTTVDSADYTLTGELVVGSSTITVNYGGKTATFGVTVSPAPTLSSISAVYTQSGTVYDTDSLDSLKDDLVVTATFEDSSTAVIPSEDYTLSGTLTVGTSTVTASYGGKTATFTVTVTSSVDYVAVGSPTISGGILTVEEGKFVRSTYALNPTSGQSWKVRMKYKYNTMPSAFVNIVGGCGADNVFAKTFVVQQNTSKQLIMYFSADKTNWTVSNQYTGTNMPISTDTWYFYEVGYDGSAYFMNLYSDGWDGTRLGYRIYTSNVVMYNGEYVGFGVPSTVNGLDGQIDLRECKIYVDDTIVWSAIA